MITSWGIYWITRLDGINGVCLVAMLLFAILLVILGMFYAKWINECLYRDSDIDKRKQHWRRYTKIMTSLVVAFMFFLTGAVLIPTTKEFAAIYLLPKVVNNEQAQKIPDNVLKLLNGKLEEWIGVIPKKEKK